MDASTRTRAAGFARTRPSTSTRPSLIARGSRSGWWRASRAASATNRARRDLDTKEASWARTGQDRGAVEAHVRDYRLTANGMARCQYCRFRGGAASDVPTLLSSLDVSAL